MVANLHTRELTGKDSMIADRTSLATEHRTILLSLLIFSLSLFSAVGVAETQNPADGSPLGSYKVEAATASPNMVVCTHRYNNLHLPISNFGYIGSAGGGWLDCETGTAAESAVFPAGSRVQHLYVASLWIGAVVGEDTLVSVGFNGWAFQYELLPCSDRSDCTIEKRSSRPADDAYHPDAKADLEFHTSFTDTVIDRSLNGADWNTSRGHIPLNIAVDQTTYSWSVDYAQDFVILDYKFTNVGIEPLQYFYIGVYNDGDVGHQSSEGDIYIDDICGFRQTFPSQVGGGYLDTINYAWIADNDGDGDDGVYNFQSATSVAGIRVMRLPGRLKKVSFNWWVSNSNSALDWGPMIEASKRNFGTGGSGTPEGDRNKFFTLSNGEQDYDQTHAGLDYSEYGWLPPNPSVGEAVATGGDTRYCVSAGPFEIDPGETLPFTMAYVAGENFHRNPRNFQRNIIDRYDPETFYANVDFRDVADNAVWASWIYDNPGYDTDGDGDRGPYWLIQDTINGKVVTDTFFYAGDGVPDYRAATAPPPPVVRHSTTHESVTLRWNGYASETATDPFTRAADFEGYKVYMGRLPQLAELALLTSNDFYNFSRAKWEETDSAYALIGLPLTLDSLEKLYGEGFEPSDYPCDSRESGFVSEGEIYCFTELGWNQSIDGWQDGAFAHGSGSIEKTYADEINAGIVTSEQDSNNADLWVTDLNPVTGDSMLYHKFYEYEYTIDNLLPSVPWYFAVTAFDFGDFNFGLNPLESSPITNLVKVWAINDNRAVRENNLEVVVYPNPYIGDGSYNTSGYEDPNRTGFVDHERRLHFVNLPAECTLKLFTVSGDLVREIKHPGPFSNAETHATWDLRSANNELVASGIYIFVVESVQSGKQMGKIVIVL